ncbi:MAG: DUF2513 domain-containing protein [Bryobacteraceae bacterium]
MQRNMDLIREILIRMEAEEHAYAPKLDIDGHTHEEIGFHVWLLGDAGLIRAHNVTSLADRSPMAVPRHLTWQGYEFLATAKNDSVWRKGTATVMAKAGTIGFELLKAVLMAELRGQMGLP